MSRQSSRSTRWIGFWVYALWGGCNLTLLAGETDFDLYYLTFLKIEMEARELQASHGDEPYLLRLYSDRALSHVRSHYTHFGSHPEIDPPNRNPDENEIPGVIALSAGREFIQKNYLDFWAAAYLTQENAPIKQAAPKEKVDPFMDLGEGDEEIKSATAPSRGRWEWMRDQLAFFYSEDLFLQKRVEELARLHGEDDSELIAGLTGRQLISYMRENLPEPDPQVLKGEEALPAKRSIVDPDNRFSNGGVGTAVADGSSENRTKQALWILLGATLIAGAWAAISFRKARR